MRCLALAFILCLSFAVAHAEPPRLVVQITVDQLRGDMLPRLRDEFSAGGFRRLLDRGVYYANAHYETGNTFTASGHAVLVTGADTAEHGMVANEWFDRESGRTMYCTADPRYPVLTETPRSGAGLSPANLTSTTLADELVLASSGHSRAFAVAGKDRSAIIPAGRQGKAFWFSDSTGGFVSSTYYYDALPAWARAWNERKLHEAYRNLPWKPLGDAKQYKQSAQVDNAHARPNATLGRIFPHLLNAASDAAYLSALRSTPYLDELTAAFVLELIRQEKLGQGAGTDYLSISFSASDYIGHTYGPNSVEAEDNLLRLDTLLDMLFDAVDEAVGFDRTVIVLSADHGVDEIPEERRELGFVADRIYPERLRQRANEVLKARFKVAELVAAFVPPGFYLDRPRIAGAKLDATTVESALAEELRAMPGIAYAFTRADLLAGRIARTPLLTRVQRSFHPTRSGDVVIVQSQFWYLYPDAEAFAAMHGSPYSYDTFVPILWWAPDVQPAIVHEPVSPAWIVPTLASVLNIKPPSGCACTGVLPFAVPTRELPPRAGASPDTVGARPAWTFPIPIETRSRAGVMHSFW